MNDHTLTVTVSRKFLAAEDILCLELSPGEGQVLPSFEAGSHIDLHIDGFVRQYSICSSPSERNHYRLAIKLEDAGRGGSKAVHAKINEGDQITISAPRNNFPLREAAHSILIAGGIGITPMLAMAQHLFDHSQSFELHYCCRSRLHAAFHNELIDGSLKPFIHFHFDDGAADQKLALGTLFASTEADTHLYVCGPDGFMNFVTSTARDQFGWTDDVIHTESFGAIDLSEEGDQAFTIKVASTGATYIIPPDKTIIEALEAQGVDIPLSCEQGICGTCLTRVLEGTPDHRDMYLTDAEKALNDQFTPCCSRSKSPVLVLDL